MGNNLADFIERCILGKFVDCSEEHILMKRNDLAIELSCAPSQISYVLSTRFTPERGFIVKSRRGAGGFVRIIRITPASQGGDGEDKNAFDILGRLLEAQAISAREYAILNFLLEVSGDRDEQIGLLKEALRRMGDFS